MDKRRRCVSQFASVISEQHESQENNNLLLEGISVASNEVDLLRLLPKNPFLNKTWLSQHQDIDLFRAYLSSVVVPTSSVVKVGLDIHRAFKTSAYQLNPSKHTNHVDYFSPSYSTATIATTQTTHCGVVILGLTGLGKTYTLIAALSTIPQTIERTSLPGMSKVIQITWIRIDMSGIASIEALAEQIIRAIDDALAASGKVYDENLAGVRGASAKMERALRLLRTHYVTILAVDEIQADNFSRPNSVNLRFWFLRISNQKIALIFSGNPLGFELHPPKKNTDEIRYATQQLRRLFASNRTRLDPAESLGDPDWKKFIRALATCHLDGSHNSFNEGLEKLKLQLTGGFPDFYAALHWELEKLRLDHPNLIVDQQLIHKAATASSLIQVMQPLITAFAMQDPIALRRCVDVDHEYYLQKWRRSFSHESNHTTDVQSANPTTSSTAPEIDPVIAIEKDRKKLEDKRDRERAKANMPTSSIKAEVLGHHLDHLKMLIAGNALTDADE